VSQPSDLQTYAFEQFGFAGIFWGLLLACKRDDRARVRDALERVLGWHLGSH